MSTSCFTACSTFSNQFNGTYGKASPILGVNSIHYLGLTNLSGRLCYCQHVVVRPNFHSSHHKEIIMSHRPNQTSLTAASLDHPIVRKAFTASTAWRWKVRLCQPTTWSELEPTPRLKDSNGSKTHWNQPRSDQPRRRKVGEERCQDWRRIQNRNKVFG